MKITNPIILFSISFPFIGHYLSEFMYRNDIINATEAITQAGLGLAAAGIMLIALFLMFLSQLVCVSLNIYKLIKIREMRTSKNIGITLLGLIVFIVVATYLIVFL